MSVVRPDRPIHVKPRIELPEEASLYTVLADASRALRAAGRDADARDLLTKAYLAGLAVASSYVDIRIVKGTPS